MKSTKNAKTKHDQTSSWDYEAEYRCAIQKLWPDLLVKVEERIFSTHRHLLIHYCDYFKEFFERVYEQYPDQRKSVMIIVLSDFSSSNFARVLHWMYTGNITLENDNVAETFLISKNFGIGALVLKTLEFAKNYAKTYVDFYEMCSHLVPMDPDLFYTCLELGYLSPFSCDNYLDTILEWLSNPLPYQESVKELNYSKELKEFRISFDLENDLDIKTYPPLNCTPIPTKTLNVLLGKWYPKSTILKPRSIDKKGKYVTSYEGKIERKKDPKISSETKQASKATETQQKGMASQPTPPSSITAKTSALPESNTTRPPPPPSPPPPTAQAQKSTTSTPPGAPPSPPPPAQEPKPTTSKPPGAPPPPPPPTQAPKPTTSTPSGAPPPPPPDQAPKPTATTPPPAQTPKFTKSKPPGAPPSPPPPAQEPKPTTSKPPGAPPPPPPPAQAPKPTTSTPSGAPPPPPPPPDQAPKSTTSTPPPAQTSKSTKSTPPGAPPPPPPAPKPTTSTPSVAQPPPPPPPAQTPKSTTSTSTPPPPPAQVPKATASPGAPPPPPPPSQAQAPPSPPP